jgi:lactoylglutathione lyase
MKLGAFSISLSVKDLAASRDFYLNLGFEIVGGAFEENWLIMRNEGHTIGLFQGMFEGNILTFNPGWSDTAQPVADFEDVRDIQRRLRDRGVALTSTTDPEGTEPASITLTDPDGNAILIDQHVPKA